MARAPFGESVDDVEDDDRDAASSYWLRVGQKEFPLAAGETLIGRGEACTIVVNEGLVSRRHARIVMDGARPFIEDLGSSNGTFVNQARLHGRAVLFPGDHVFVGTAEIEIVRRVVEDRTTIPLIEPTRVRQTPASGVSAFDVAPPSMPTSSARRRAAGSDSSRSVESTTQLEGFEYIGRLADKMLTMGRIDAALKILSGHIEQIVDSARDRKPVDGLLVDSVGRYAVKLANETLDARWVNLAVELHLIACRPLREETLQQLASLRAKAPIGDDRLIERYYEKLRSQLAAMSLAERVLCERVACLIPGL